MQSKAANVSAYLAELPEDRRRALKKLRGLCRECLKGYEEGMDYGMPTYKRDGTPEVAFASQKQYVSLYVMKQDVVNDYKQALTGCRIGKGCIRFSKPDKIDFKLVGALLRAAAKSKSRPC